VLVCVPVVVLLDTGIVVGLVIPVVWLGVGAGVGVDVEVDAGVGVGVGEVDGADWDGGIPDPPWHSGISVRGTGGAFDVVSRPLYAPS